MKSPESLKTQDISKSSLPFALAELAKCPVRKQATKSSRIATVSHKHEELNACRSTVFLSHPASAQRFHAAPNSFYKDRKFMSKTPLLPINGHAAQRADLAAAKFSRRSSNPSNCKSRWRRFSALSRIPLKRRQVRQCPPRGVAGAGSGSLLVDSRICLISSGWRLASR